MLSLRPPRRVPVSLHLLAGLAAAIGPLGAPAALAADAEPKVVLAITMDGKAYRGGRPVDEARLKADLAALNKGDQVLLCLQGMNGKVSDAFDRYVLQNPGAYDASFLTKGRCPGRSRHRRRACEALIA